MSIITNLSNTVDEKNKKVNIKFLAYNCYGFKSNSNFIKNLIQNYDICFFSEHWLSDEEEILFNNLSNHHKFYFKSSYSKTDTKRRGRPFGGICWSVSKKLLVERFEFFDIEVSSLAIRLNNLVVTFHGVWLPYDDKRANRLSKYKSNFSLLKSQIKEYHNSPQIIFGDFNASTNRTPSTRFDKLLIDFIDQNGLINTLDIKKFNKGGFTYKKGKYESTIDHIIINQKATELLQTAEIINDKKDLSDHRPVAGMLSLDIDDSFKKIEEDKNEEKFFHFFDWKNPHF
ncbi:unnamed protein product, partial [Brachionus calyciflorus]